MKNPYFCLFVFSNKLFQTLNITHKMVMQENVEFDNGKNEGDEITSFAEEEVGKTPENKNNNL